MRFSVKAGLAAVVVTGALAGVGQAAFSNDGVVTMCANNSTGALRVVDPSGVGRPCGNTETVLPINQKGPEGPAGPAGAPGAAGPAGPVSLPSVVAKWRKGNWKPGEDYYSAIDLTMFKGVYHVTAKGTAYMYEALGHEYWAAVTCQLRVKHANGKSEVMDTTVVEVSDGGPEYGSFALQGVMRIDTSVPETAEVACKDDGGPGGKLTVLRHLNLHGLPISGYVQVQQ